MLEQDDWPKHQLSYVFYLLLLLLLLLLFKGFKVLQFVFMELQTFKNIWDKFTKSSKVGLSMKNSETDFFSIF